MIDFHSIDKAEKAAIFTEIATQMGMKPFAVEKDWWVSRSLEIIFGMPISAHLVFKGGTSLSKAWKLISRFSEDIDLANLDFEVIEAKDSLAISNQKPRTMPGLFVVRTISFRVRSRLGKGRCHR